MVMHARKLPRFNDGYYEKHQSSHSSHQSSKYSSSKSNSYSDRFSQDRSDRSRGSPNGSNSRSNSHERDHSPRNRSFGSKSWFSHQSYQKDRDRGSHRNEQGRDRNESVRDRSNKDRHYSTDYSRSPKDRRSLHKDITNLSNHDRNNCDKLNSVSKGSGPSSTNSSKETLRKATQSSTREKRDERERTLRVGDWTEHTSKGGKKYYYNCKTEVSQWEKPREWLEKEGVSQLLRKCGSSSRSSSDKHSISRSSNSNVSSNYRDQSKYSCPKDKEITCNSWNNKDAVSQHQHKEDLHDHRFPDGVVRSLVPDGSIHETSLRDKEILNESNALTPDHYMPNVILPQHSFVDGQVFHCTSVNSLTGMIPSSNKSISHTGLRIDTKGELNSLNHSDSCSNSIVANNSSNALLLATENNLASNSSRNDQPISACDTGGPPTPTHSEGPDDSEQKCVSAESSSVCVSALQGITSLQSGNYPMTLPQLTPGLSQYVKDDLTDHIRGWPAEACEKKAHLLATETHMTTSMRITDVSIALKSARSRVRLNEIQSTLLEQRVMLYRHEVRSLENMRTPSLFASDDN